jgi:hypothetical protein
MLEVLLSRVYLGTTTVAAREKRPDRQRWSPQSTVENALDFNGLESTLFRCDTCPAHLISLPAQLTGLLRSCLTLKPALRAFPQRKQRSCHEQTLPVEISQ